jgi:hypothetical protein
MGTKFVTMTGCSLLALAPPVISAADANDPLHDRFSLSLGTFLLHTSTQIRVDGTTGRGTQIDTNRDLGLKDSDRFRIDGYWRFAKRHKLRLMYFDARQDATRTADRTIDIGDTVFPVNASITSRFETRVFEIAYEYAFFRGDKYEVTGTFGIHDLKFAFDASGETLRAGQPINGSREADANGPLPVIGVRWLWTFNRNFYLDTQAQFFRISLNPYDGRLEDYNASVVWAPFKHFALGAGYNEFVTRLDVAAARFNGSLRWRYGGARIFVTASF